MVADDERGQALSFEGIAAAIILLSAVGFALQVTAVTPLSPSTSSQHVENQLEATGNGALDSAYGSGALDEALLFWDPDSEQFHESGDSAAHYRGQPYPGLRLTETLNRTYGQRNVAYNIFVHYHTDDAMETQRLVEQGRPSEHAVSASRTVVLFEDDRLVEADGSRGAQLEGSQFYAPNVDIGENVYNVARVEVVAWRI